MLRCPPRRTKCGAGLVALQVCGAADRASVDLVRKSSNGSRQKELEKRCRPLPGNFSLAKPFPGIFSLKIEGLWMISTGCHSLRGRAGV